MGTTHRTISNSSSSSSSSSSRSSTHACSVGSSRGETVVTTRLGTPPTTLHSSRSSFPTAQRQGLSLVLLLIAVAATSQRLFVSFVDIGDTSDRALLATTTTTFTQQTSEDSIESAESAKTLQLVHSDVASATTISTGSHEPKSPFSLRSSSHGSTAMASAVVTTADTNGDGTEMKEPEDAINNVAAAAPYTPLESSTTVIAAPTKSPSTQPPTFPTTEYMATNLASDPDYPHYRQLSDLLMGPALDNNRNAPLKQAICEFRLVKYGKHFPHVYVYHTTKQVCKSARRSTLYPRRLLSHTAVSFSHCRLSIVPRSLPMYTRTRARAHSMQQFYRCFSWWLAHPHLPAILVTGHKTQWAKHTPFIQGYLAILKLGMNLTVVPEYHSPTSHVPVRDTNGNNETLVLRSVQAKDTGKWDGDTAVTDFAMLDPNRTLYQYAVQYLTHQPKFKFLAKEETVACPKSANHRPKVPRIAILNRDSKARNLTNAHAMAARLSATFSQTVPLVTFDYKTDFASQVSFFVNTDIVISPHGAQLTGMAFLPRCASVLEVFPSRYLVADYFGSLAAALNIRHGFVYVNHNAEDVIPHDERFHYIRRFSRKEASVEPDLETVERAVRRLVAQWQDCVCSNESTIQ
jgi:Glycosyltransferase 61